MVQASQTALTNGHAGMNERLARWILMSHDRFQGDDLTVTHEFISLMLGVRRRGVTESLHMLEGKHLIRSTRDHVHVLDREGLIDLASGSYGVVDAGVSREHADVYSESIRRGGTLVNARVTDQEAARLEGLLDRYDPIDPAERGRLYRQEGWASFDPKAPPYRPSETDIERIRRDWAA
jgi:hypothetical protein